MADFRVYYDAANAFIHDTQLYGKAFGVSSGFYKYSPFACIPFIPLAILPYGLASIIYYLIITFTICWFLVKLMHDPEISNSNKSLRLGLVYMLVALFMADHFERELHLGNVNLFLLIITYFIFHKIKDGQQLQSGVLMGILLMFKPHFLILIPYMVWRKKWKTLSTSFVTILACVLAPSLIKGYNGNIQLHAEWLIAMRDHNVKLEDSPNTIYGIFNDFVLHHQGGMLMVGILLIIIAGLFLILLINNQKTMGNDHIRFIEFFLLIALIPNLTHTDTEHFMWTLPLIAYVIFSILKFDFKWKPYLIILMILAFIPYCINSPDIVGKKMSHLFDEEGLLGIANLAIISTAVMIWFKLRNQNHSTIAA
jgi:hypothetical protein